MPLRTTRGESGLGILGRVVCASVVLAASVLLSSASVRAQTQTFQVSAPNMSAWIVDGATNPTLNLQRGKTYAFSINVTGHPFYVQSTAGTGGAAYNDGVSGQGTGATSTGVVTFTPPWNAPSTLYYQCSYHGSMVGTLSISGTAPKPAGQSCTTGTDCQSGFCVSSVCCNVSSCPGDACNTGACGSTGSCIKVPVADGTACNDGNACTLTDTCKAGACAGGNTKTCTALDQCHVAGTCNTSTGACSNPNAADGKPCADGDACTVSDVCTAGTCKGVAMTCTSPGTCEDTPGSCTNNSGVCTYPALPAGRWCSTDPSLVDQSCDGNRHCTGGHADQGGLYMWGDDSSGQLGDRRTGSGTISRTPVPYTDADPTHPVAGMSNVVQVAAGYDHTIVLDVKGEVLGFGANNAGQVTGNSSSTGITAPQTVFLGALGVAAGNGFTVVLDSNRGVRMWGILGSATLSFGGAPAIAIAAGSRHALALTADGKVWAWGTNGSGQLGNGKWSSSTTTAVSVSLPLPARAIAAGNDFSLALLANGAVYAWGDNYYGEIAQPVSTTASNLPQPVNLTNVRAIAAGGWHALALLADGSLVAWGENYYGQLGPVASGTLSPYPVPVTGVSRVAAIAAAAEASVALRADGTLLTWGNNSFGELGTGSTASFTPNPQPITTLAGIVQISASSFSIGVIKGTGTIRSFGNNSNGQLGSGQTATQLASSSTPVAIAPASSSSPLPPFKAVSSGAAQHRLALATDGSVWAWGSNQYGALGNTSGDSAYPVKVTGVSDVIAVYTGDLDSFALRADGTLWSWGSNVVGNQGIGSTSTAAFPTPTRITSLSNVIDAGARNNTLALLADGTVYAWGWNRYDQCGTTGAVNSPLKMTLPTTSPYARAVAAGTYDSYILLADGTVASFGRNDGAELGTGAASGTYDAVAHMVSGAAQVTALSAGFRFGLILMGSYMYGWGVNSAGQLGTVSSPVRSPTYLGASYVKSISASYADAYAVDDQGYAFAMGSNAAGSLGAGSTAASSSYWVQLSGGVLAIGVDGGYQGGELLLQ